MKKIISNEAIENRDSILQWIPKSFEPYINCKHVPVKCEYTTKDGSKEICNKEMNVNVDFIFDLTHKLICKVFRTGDNIFYLNSVIFRKMYGANYKYIIQFLINVGFLKRVRNHCVGKNSRKYEVNKELFMEPDSKIRVFNTNKTIINKYKKIFYSCQFVDICSDESEVISTLSPIKKLLAYDLLFVEIDLHESKRYLDSLYKSGEIKDIAYNKNLMSVEEIAHKQPYFIEDKYGRFHTNFTTLKSHIRSSFLRIDGHPVCDTDIKNSQPRLLIQLLKETNFDKNEPLEFQRYLQTVKNGRIYEEIMEISDFNREEAKKLIYKVFFGKNYESCRYNKIFKTLYPRIFEWMKIYKRDDSKILAHKLQKIESSLIFDNICTKIKRDMPDIKLFTVHDSIYYPAHYKERVETIFFREIESI
jgi:hypothetical protein